ncbi:MAG: DegT/DnrJ/EryC1/StrS family aminotransferase [Lysobacteraceae bacterium]
MPALLGGGPAFSTPLPSSRPVQPNRQTLHEHLDAILDRNWYTNNGPLVRELELRLARQMQVRNCVLCSSATMGLELLSRTLNLTGEVIVPAFTFVATAHAFLSNGGNPVFCDIDAETMTMSPEHCAKLVGRNTRAICAVHLWGRPAKIAAFQAIADEYDIPLLFDAAHAFGVSIHGRPIGGFGRAEVFSFHATKLFHTMEGGAVTTNDDELADQIRQQRNFGFVGYDETDGPGTNAKMTEMSAAFGLSALDCFNETRERSREVYKRYQRLLAELPGMDLVEQYDNPTHHRQYVVALLDESAFGLTRDQLIESLHAENIIARRYFAPGCHRLQPYATREGGSPVLETTDRIVQRVIVLPGGAAITNAEIDLVVDRLTSIHRYAARIRTALDS